MQNVKFYNHELSKAMSGIIVCLESDIEDTPLPVLHVLELFDLHIRETVEVNAELLAHLA